MGGATSHVVRPFFQEDFMVENAGGGSSGGEGEEASSAAPEGNKGHAFQHQNWIYRIGEFFIGAVRDDYSPRARHHSLGLRPPVRMEAWVSLKLG